jgi:hypothetical protein
MKVRCERKRLYNIFREKYLPVGSAEYRHEKRQDHRVFGARFNPGARLIRRCARYRLDAPFVG